MTFSSASLLTPKIDVRLRIRRGEGPLVAHRLTEVLTLLGRGDVCDVRLTSSRIEGPHTAIIKLDGGLFVCDLARPGGTTLNGNRVRWTRLSQGDVIGVGPFQITLDVESLGELTTTEQPLFSLRNEQVIGKVTSIDPVLIVGRDPGCDVVIHDETVALQHCMVAWTQEGPLLRDLQKHRRTRLNGSRDHNGRLVRGDILGIGKHELRFETNIALPVLDRSEQVEEEGIEYVGSGDPSVIVAGRLPIKDIARDPDFWPATALNFMDPPVAENQQTHIVSRKTEAVESPQETNLNPKNPAQHTADGLECTFPVAASVAGDHQETMMVREKSEPAGLSTLDSPSGEDMLAIRTHKLLEKTSAIRARVAAAQHALDERAKKYRQGLEAQRRRIETRWEALHQQAQSLGVEIHQTMDDTAQQIEVGPRQSECDRNPTAEQDGSSPDIQDDHMVNPTATTRDLSGESNNEQAVSTKEVPMINKDQVKLEDHVAELVDLARSEQSEAVQGRTLIQSLRTETHHLRTLVAKRQKDLRDRKSELDDRFNSLLQTREKIRKEREPLTLRLRELEAEELAIQSRMEEGERVRDELVHEAELLEAARNRLKMRQQELFGRLEGEHKRLQERQASLHVKTAELEQVLHGRMNDIESELALCKMDLRPQIDELASDDSLSRPTTGTPDGAQQSQAKTAQEGNYLQRMRENIANLNVSQWVALEGLQPDSINKRNASQPLRESKRTLAANQDTHTDRKVSRGRGENQETHAKHG